MPEIDFTSLTWPSSSRGSASTSGRRRSTGSPMPSTPEPMSSPSAPCSPPTARSPISTPSPRRPPPTGRSRSSTAPRPPAGSRSTAPGSTLSPVPPTNGSCRRAARRSSRSQSARSSRRRRWRPTGSPPRTATAATTTTTCAWPTTRGGSTSHRHGSPGSARSPPCACSARSESARFTTTTSGSRTGFATGLDLPPSNSAIVSTNLPGADERLERAGIRAAVRGGALRASFHLYNTEEDVDAALSALLD